jgi:hypothetical protein
MMDDKEKDRGSQEEEKKAQWSVEDGLKFLKELREMPYDNSKVGYVFVTSSFRSRLPDKKNSDKEQRKLKKKLE